MNKKSAELGYRPLPCQFNQDKSENAWRPRLVCTPACDNYDSMRRYINSIADKQGRQPLEVLSDIREGNFNGQLLPLKARSKCNNPQEIAVYVVDLNQPE